MSKLKTGIAELQTVLQNNQEVVDKLAATYDKHDKAAVSQMNVAIGGIDTLAMYLVNKFKKQGTDQKAQGAVKLSALNDAEVTNMVKSLLVCKQTAKNEIVKLQTEANALAHQALASAGAAETKSATLKAYANGKKDKWMATAAYKDKVNGYITTLDGIARSVAGHKTSVAKVTQSVAKMPSWVDSSLPYSTAMTVAEAVNLASATVQNWAKNYGAQMTAAKAQVRGWRDSNKPMDDQIKKLAEWGKSADKMDS
jgi:hypothetical protein